MVRVRARLAGAVAGVLAGAAVLAGSLLAEGLASVPAAASGAGGPAKVTAETPVTAMHQGQGVAHNSPQLAADPTARRFVVAASRQDAPAFGCGLKVSGSGGRGWRPADPVTELPEGAKTCYAPEVAFGPTGRLYYLFAGLHGRGNEPLGVFLASSDDRARSFSDPQRVLGEHNFSVRMAVDRSVGERGRLYLAWLHASSDPPLGAMPPPPNPIRFAASDDGGESWSEPVGLNPPEQQRVAAPAMTVGPDGTVYVAYYDLEDDRRDYRGLGGPVYEGTWSLVLARSTDGGQTFETTVVDDGVRPAERVMLIFTMSPPALAAGPDGRVCLGWPDARHGDADVLARCSTDQGDNWNGPTRVNDDAEDSGATQLLPQLAFAPSGRLDAVFVDRRDDPRDEAQHTYYAASHDAGASFGDNLRVTSQSSYARIGQRYVGPAAEGQVEFGSRLGLLARDDHAVAMWPDTRNSRLGTTGQDLFAARVAAGGADGGGDAGTAAAALAGAGLVVAGLLAGGLGVAYRLRRRPASPPSPETADEGGDDQADGHGPGEHAPQTTADPPPRARGAAWRRARRGAPVVATGVVVAVAGVWLWGGDQPAAGLPDDPPQVAVTIDEQGLGYEGAIPPGRVVFRVANRGEVPHELALLPMGEDEAPLGEQLADDEAQAKTPFAGVAPLDPGETTAFAVDLAPDSRYVLVDYAPDPLDGQGRSHAQQGYHAEFHTAGSAPGGSAGGTEGRPVSGDATAPPADDGPQDRLGASAPSPDREGGTP